MSCRSCFERMFIKSKASSSWAAGGAGCALAPVEGRKTQAASAAPRARKGHRALRSTGVSDRGRRARRRVVAKRCEDAGEDALRDEVCLRLGEEALRGTVPHERFVLHRNLEGVAERYREAGPRLQSD